MNATNDTFFPTTQGELGAFAAHWAIFWFNYAIYIIACLTVIILNFVWRKEQPMKSRFFTPTVIMTAQIAYVATWIGFQQLPTLFYWVQFTQYPFEFAVPASVFQTASFVMLEIASAAYAMHVLRYLILRHYTLLQRRQFALAVSTARNAGEAIPKPSPVIARLLRFYKFLLSPTAYWLMVLSPALIFVPLTALFQGLQYGLKGARYAVQWDAILFYIFFGYMVLVLALPCYLAFIIDFGMNIRAVFHKGGLRFFFFDSEPLLFRVEVVVIFVEIILAIVGTVFQSLSTSNPFVKSFGGRWTMRWIGAFLTAGYYWCVWLQGGGIAAMATLRSVIKKRKLGLYDDPTTSQATDTGLSHMGGPSSEIKGKTGRTKDLYEVLLDEHGMILFEAYCKSEFSLENLLAWKQILNYERSQVAKEREQIAELMLESFVEQGAIMEINISAEQRNKVRTTMTEFRSRALEHAHAMARLGGDNGGVNHHHSLTHSTPVAAQPSLPLDQEMLPKSVAAPSSLPHSPGSPSLFAASPVGPVTPSPQTPADTALLIAAGPHSSLDQRSSAQGIIPVVVDESGEVSPATPPSSTSTSSTRNTANNTKKSNHNSFFGAILHGQSSSSSQNAGNNEPMLPNDLYASIKRTLESNLLDTFSRFVLTQTYAHYKTHANELLDLVRKSRFA